MENISNKIEEKRSIFNYVVSYFDEMAAENGWSLWVVDHVDSSVWWPLNGEVLFTATRGGDGTRLTILSLSIRDDIDRDDLLNRYKERLLELGIITKEQVQKEENSVNLSTCTFDVASMYPERLFKTEEEVAMEEFVRCILTILNYQLNEGFNIFAEEQKDNIYDIILIAEKGEMGGRWNKKRLLGTVDLFDRFNLGQGRIIAKLKKRIAELDPAALKVTLSEAEKEYLEHDENLVAQILQEIENYEKEHSKHNKKEETKGQMEEILKDVVNELNKEIDVKSDYYVYYRYLHDSIKADIYLAKNLKPASSKLVAEIYEGDVLFNSKDWLIEKLEEKIDNLAPEALNQNDKYLRALIRRIRKDLKEEEEMPTSMHEFQFSSIAVVNSIPKVKRVTFSGPATIVFFEDGTKTVAKCHDPEKFDKWSGIAICICKKYYGKNFKKFFKEWDGDKELRRLERKEKKARKKMKNVKTHDDIFRENDKTMEELWIKEEGEDV